MKQNRGIIVGVTGGVGAGKSTVLRLLQGECPCVLLLADDIAKEMMLPGGATYAPLVEAFGTDILNENGEIDKGRFASIIFADETANDRVNAIVHPIVVDYMRETAFRYKEEADSFCIIAMEAALLIESGLYRDCDRLWYVYASEKVRTERLIESRGYTRKKCRDIMDCQLSEKEFRTLATDVISTEGTLEETWKQVQALVMGLKKTQNEEEKFY